MGFCLKSICSRMRRSWKKKKINIPKLLAENSIKFSPASLKEKIEKLKIDPFVKKEKLVLDFSRIVCIYKTLSFKQKGTTSALPPAAKLCWNRMMVKFTFRVRNHAHL